MGGGAAKVSDYPGLYTFVYSSFGSNSSLISRPTYRTTNADVPNLTLTNPLLGPRVARNVAEARWGAVTPLVEYNGMVHDAPRLKCSSARSRSTHAGLQHASAGKSASMA